MWIHCWSTSASGVPKLIIFGYFLCSFQMQPLEHVTLWPTGLCNPWFFFPIWGTQKRAPTCKSSDKNCRAAECDIIHQDYQFWSDWPLCPLLHGVARTSRTHGKHKSLAWLSQLLITHDNFKKGKKMLFPWGIAEFKHNSPRGKGSQSRTPLSLISLSCSTQWTAEGWVPHLLLSLGIESPTHRLGFISEQLPQWHCSQKCLQSHILSFLSQLKSGYTHWASHGWEISKKGWATHDQHCSLRN